MTAEATPPGPDGRPRVDHAPTGRVVAALLPACVVPFLASLIYFVAFAGESWARWVYVLVKIFTLVWPVVATVWILGRRLPRVDWRAPRHRRALVAGALFGGAVVVAVFALLRTPVGDQIVAFAPQIRAKVAQLGVLEHYAAFALFLSFAHSALEEYYWRWFVFGRLREVVSQRLALPIAALAFASHHAVVVGQYVSLPWAILGTAAVAFAGGVWCWMYERQRTLTGAWISHVLADLVVLWVGYRMLF